MKKYSTWSRRVERNLLSVWHRASRADFTEGMLWYQHAHQQAENLAARYSLPVKGVCGAIAALSPGLAWERNVEDAALLCEAVARNIELPVVGTYGRRNVQKAVACLQGTEPLDVLGGMKVRSFYRNIMQPCESEEVTVDRHMRTAAFALEQTEDNAIVRDNEYRYIRWHTQALARRFSVVPCQFQAVIWVTWRRLQGNINQMDIPF